MNSQEIISENVQGQRRSEVGFLFGKAGRQAGKSSHFCSQGQVSTLDVSRCDQVFIGSATNDSTLDTFELTRTIAFSVSLCKPVVFDFPTVVDWGFA